MNELLVWLARGTLHATVVAALVLLVRALLLRQMPPRLLSLLWTILLVRMVLPWAPGSAFSIHNLIGDPWATAWAPGAAPALADAGTDALPEGVPLGISAGSGHAGAAALPPNADGTSSSGATGIVAAALLPTVWLLGALVLAGLTIVINVVHWRRICQAPPVTDTDALCLLRQCRRKMGLTKDPCLVETDRVRNPALFGMIRPRLLLPAGTVTALSRTELRHVFMHELAHLKRRDILLSWVGAALQIVHWFNPLIWFAFRRWRADRETMCDALALAHIPAGESHCYAVTLVSLAERRSGPNLVPSLASFLEREAQLKRRISMIHKHDVLRRRTPWFALGVIVLVGYVSLTNARENRFGSREADGAPPTWKTADGTRPDYVPETSWLDENGHIRDQTDYPFVDDPPVLGVWTSVDFVEAIDDFDPAQRSWKGRLHFRKVEFVEQGSIQGQFGDSPTLKPLSDVTWTKGLMLSASSNEQTAEEYVIKSIDGVDYLFMQWKSGDYKVRHQKPSYYVFVWGDVSTEANDVAPPSDGDNASAWSNIRAEAVDGPPTWKTADGTRPDYVPETSWLDAKGHICDKTDDPFVDDPAVVGVWASVDFVRAIDDFDPAERRWKGGSFHLRKLEFVEQGGIKAQFGDSPALKLDEGGGWTNGLLLGGDTAEEYVIKSIDGVDYLFMQWKSGDYTIRHQKPAYYVMRRADD
jgi:bla regulator protein BlaR1